MQWKKAASAALGLFLAAVAAAWAQGHINVTTVAQIEKKIVDEKGQTKIERVAAGKAAPGSEVIFTTHYENISNETVENAVITNPIPQEMIFQKGSARGGSAIIYSVDGGKRFDAAAMLFVFDGSGRKFPARPQDYTHIRWIFDAPLPPGAKGEVSFRAILKD